jgi:PleD family two-component response regulator
MSYDDEDVSLADYLELEEKLECVRKRTLDRLTDLTNAKRVVEGIEKDIRNLDDQNRRLSETMRSIRLRLKNSLN